MSRTRQDIEARLLSEKLPAHVISERSGLSYVEGHYVSRTLNEVFGPLGWRLDIRRLDCVSSEPHFKGKGDKAVQKGHRVGYICQARLAVDLDGTVDTIYNHYDRSKEDVGAGEGFGELPGAHESAAKEAVTDALKRCARHLGDIFGLALYDGQGADGDNVRETGLADIDQALLYGGVDRAKAVYQIMKDQESPDLEEARSRIKARIEADREAG